MDKPEEILQKAREAKGLSQKALAARMGLSHRMYQRYEEGKFPKYKSDNIKKIDKFLGTNIYDIIYDTIVLHETRNVVNEPLQGKYTSTLEDLVKAQREISEGKARIAELEAILNDMGKLQEIVADYRASLSHQSESERDGAANSDEHNEPALKRGTVKPIDLSGKQAVHGTSGKRGKRT